MISWIRGKELLSAQDDDGFVRLAQGANIEQVDLDVLFMNAVFYGCLGACRCLLQMGADIDVDMSRSLVLALTSQRTNERDKKAMVHFLLDSGIILQPRIMYYACDEWAVYLLASRGANVNSSDAVHFTPLDVQVKKRNYDLVDALLNVGGKTSSREPHTILRLILNRRHWCRQAARTLWALLRYRVPMRYPIPKPLLTYMARHVWATRRKQDLWSIGEEGE